jgi:hypothetical protein
MPEERIFRFAQFEFPWVLGPADGRYVHREPGGGEPRHVLVIATLGAPQRRLLTRRGRSRPAAPEPDPTPVTTTRVTVIEAAPDGDAGGWPGGASGAGGQAAIEEAIEVVNAVLHAHRIASADAMINEVSLEQAIAARLGRGTGEQVAEGRWTEAVDVPALPRRRRRVAALRPQERLAALLGGSNRPLACEELTLRARSDLDAARTREAALQLRVALEAALVELDSGAARDMPQRIDDLRAQRGAVGAAANEALEGGLDPETARDVEHALGRLEAALRARTAAGVR